MLLCAACPSQLELGILTTALLALGSYKTTAYLQLWFKMDENEHPTFTHLCAVLDVDEERLEAFLPHLAVLLEIGVDFNDVRLRDAIEAYPSEIGYACQCIIEYAGWLVHKGQTFESPTHATVCLIRAFQEHWRPYQGWHQYAHFASRARYVSSYEYAYRLISEINRVRGYTAWSVRILDPLSEEAIEALIPELELELSRS